MKLLAKNRLQKFLWGVAALAILVLLLAAASFAYYWFDARSVRKEVVDLPDYYQLLAAGECADIVPGEKSEEERSCCVSSVRSMAVEGAQLAPRAFTGDPSRGCSQGTYVRLLCGGSMEWCAAPGAGEWISFESISADHQVDADEARYHQVIGSLGMSHGQSTYTTSIQIEEETDHHMKGQVAYKYDQSQNGTFYATDLWPDGMIPGPADFVEWRSVQDDLQSPLSCETAAKYHFPASMTGCE
jgi:hypothetical protein